MERPVDRIPVSLLVEAVASLSPYYVSENRSVPFHCMRLTCTQAYATRRGVIHVMPNNSELLPLRALFLR